MPMGSIKNYREEERECATTSAKFNYFSWGPATYFSLGPATGNPRGLRTQHKEPAGTQGGRGECVGGGKILLL